MPEASSNSVVPLRRIYFLAPKDPGWCGESYTMSRGAPANGAGLEAQVTEKENPGNREPMAGVFEDRSGH
jgi:hypothetical protein